MEDSSVGARVMRLREKLGITRTQLAAKVGISDGGLRQLEISLTASPSFEVGLRLAAELKVNPWVLLTGQGALVGEYEGPVDPATAVVLPAITVAQLAARIEEADKLIAGLRQVASDMERGSIALAALTDSCVQAHPRAALPNGNSHRRKRAS